MRERTFDEFTVVILRWPVDAPTFTDEELEDLQERHLTHLDGLRREGSLVASGPLRDQDDERLRGICVFACTPDEARRLMARDPMVRARRLEPVAATWLAPAGEVRFPPAE